MDLRRVKDEDKLELCRKYWIGGFALLPFLWFINSVWFFNEAFRKPPYDQQRMIRTCAAQQPCTSGRSRPRGRGARALNFCDVMDDVIRSMIGTVIWVGVIVAWVTIFQLNRSAWGATADYMSFINPKGFA